MNLVSEPFDRIALAGIGIKVFPFVRVLAQVVELVLVFVPQTKLPAVRCNDGARGFFKRLLDLFLRSKLAVFPRSFFFAGRPFQKYRLSRHRFAADEGGPSSTDTLRMRSFSH